MKAFSTNNGTKELLSSDLCVRISDDDLYIVLWAFSIRFLEELIELLFYVIGFIVCRRVHVDKAVIEESALDHQHA